MQGVFCSIVFGSFILSSREPAPEHVRASLPVLEYAHSAHNERRPAKGEEMFKTWTLKADFTTQIEGGLTDFKNNPNLLPRPSSRGQPIPIAG